jgi:hypothetical protein
MMDDLLGAIHQLCAAGRRKKLRITRDFPGAGYARRRLEMVADRRRLHRSRALLAMSARNRENPRSPERQRRRAASSTASYLHRWRAHGTPISTACARSDVAAQLGGA